MKDLWEALTSEDKFVLDVTSIGVTLASFTSVLPSVSAIFALIWTMIRIYETDTIQKFLGKKK